MRTTLAIIIGLTLLLAACTQTIPEQVVRADARAQQFLRIYPDAIYDEAHFDAKTAASIEDLYRQECAAASPPFTRATLTEYGATLVAYVTEENVTCVISKIDTAPIAVKQGDPATAPVDVALTVNGRPVTIATVQATWAQLPAEQQTVESLNSILDQLIARELLLQESQSMSVSEDEVTKAYDALVEQSKVSASQFEQSLAERDIKKEDVLVTLKQDLQVQKLLDEKLDLKEITVAEEEAQQYYLTNTQSFLITEQASFAQVFITLADGEQSALARVNAAAKALEKEEFCTVVRQYSDDSTSLDRCGVYTIPRGVVEPAIERAAFSLAENQTIIIRSASGFHILRGLGTQATQVIPYAQAQQQVKGLLSNQIAQLRLNAYLASLRKGADVVVYLTAQQAQ